MTLLTIGYGNRGMLPFLQVLRESRVTHLVDVRTTPYSSYHHDFGREALSLAVREAGLRYVYMGDTLGGEAARANDEAYASGLTYLYRKLHSEPEIRACLMCGCLRAEKCHRGTIVGESLLSSGIEVFHIDENQALVSQADLRERMTPKQMPLFSV